jgi:hypothetical protein
MIERRVFGRTGHLSSVPVLATRYIRAILRHVWWYTRAVRHNKQHQGGEINQFASQPYADEASSQHRPFPSALSRTRHRDLLA